MEKELISDANGISLSILCICAMRKTAACFPKFRFFQAHENFGFPAPRRAPIAGQKAESAARTPFRQPGFESIGGPPRRLFESCTDATEPIFRFFRPGWKDYAEQTGPEKEKKVDF
jgi:hypothetical protein